MVSNALQTYHTTFLLTERVANLERANNPQNDIPMIPKPKGNSYNLQQKMGLEDDPEKYEAIKVCCYSQISPLYSQLCQAVWKAMMRSAGFEDGVTFANQSKEKIVKFAKKVQKFDLLISKPVNLIASNNLKARTDVPFLRRFRADWATEAYLRRSLRNRKGYVKNKKTKKLTARLDLNLALEDDGGQGNEMGDN